MKAAVFENYGPPDVVQIREVAKPTPRDNEVLIRVHASTVNSADWRIRSLDVPGGYGLIVRLAFGICRPRKQVLGAELAGEIIATGESVRKLSVGDRVFASPGSRFGAHAEYITLREDAQIARMPENLDFKEAAALSFGGTTALQFLQKKGRIQSGEKVLINGASGTVGTAAVQLAKHFGAEVTGVCSSANLALVTSIGADKVIDYTQKDFTENREHYDIIMDTVGNAPWKRVKHSLTDTGRLLMVVAGMLDELRAPLVSRSSGKKAIAGVAQENVEDLQLLARLAEAGRFKPVIDRCYPLAQIVDAHAYVDTGRKRGSVVISMSTSNRIGNVPAERNT